MLIKWELVRVAKNIFGERLLRWIVGMKVFSAKKKELFSLLTGGQWQSLQTVCSLLKLNT